jgi:hypothetical protein
MLKIILDTNFLMMPGQFKVDIFEELDKLNEQFELYITQGIKDELEKLTKIGKLKDRTAAKVGLKLVHMKEKAKTLKMITVERDKYVDDNLVELTKKGYIVATSDRELQLRLGSYIYLRQKKFIEMR